MSNQEEKVYNLKNDIIFKAFFTGDDGEELKFREQKPNIDEKINQWLSIIDDEDKEMIKMAETKNKTLQKAREKINYLTGDKAVRRLAELREIWEMDYNSGIDYAKQEGIEERKKRTV